ncbi:MAG: cytochrome c oxidase accessory protein CcoG [Pseudomonadota bacterium]|nr:cytochrome c oxidase accessory protein CcoG [Pseudomonadota bacterium]
MSRQWVHTASVKGRFQRIHRWTGFFLQAFLFVTPWLVVAGRPAVQIDIPARRVFALGAVYTASDAIFLVLALLIALFSLFLVTALWGRLWCGYGCPQTLFLEEWVRPLEKWIEGERGVRMARARAPREWKNLWRRIAKLTAFAVLAVAVSMTAVSWFAGARPLWTGQSSAAAYVMVGVFSAGLFADFAWFREQFCNYLCPYARFQGALSDKGSLTVQYEVALGEPRGARGAAQAADAATAGACIDCKKCVAVCPQGIDIREGFQLECVACARCIDACEGVMAKQGHEGLISYKPLTPQPKLRPRTVAYGALLTGLVTALVFQVATHDAIDASIARAPGTLFVVDADGWIRNTYLLKVINTSLSPMEATVAVEGLPVDAELSVAPVRIAAAGTATVPVVLRMRAPEGPITRLTFTVDTDGGHARLPATFTAGGG